MEGSRWDREKRVIGESHPKALYDSMPVMWLKPYKKEDIVDRPHLSPLFTKQARGEVRSLPLTVMDMRLPAGRPQSHWIMRGVALLCHLDD